MIRTNDFLVQYYFIHVYHSWIRRWNSGIETLHSQAANIFADVGGSLDKFIDYIFMKQNVRFALVEMLSVGGVLSCFVLRVACFTRLD